DVDHHVEDQAVAGALARGPDLFDRSGGVRRRCVGGVQRPSDGRLGCEGLRPVGGRVTSGGRVTPGGRITSAGRVASGRRVTSAGRLTPGGRITSAGRLATGRRRRRGSGGSRVLAAGRTLRRRRG